MSIPDHLNKIKSKGDWVLWLVIVLSLALGVGFGRLWGLTSSRPPVKIIEPQIIESVAQNNQATIITSSQELAKPAGKSVGKYVASKNSDKYHLATCPGAQRIKEENKIWFDSKEAAEKAGLTPAANCPGI